MTRATQIALIVLIAMAALAALLTRGGSPGTTVAPPAPEEAAAQPPPGPPPVAEESGGEAPASAGLPRFVEVGADRCVPCKMMQPILDQLRTAYAGKLDIEFADVWKDPELGKRYAVQTIPTQIIYDAAGREVFRHTGYWPKEDIDRKLSELGVL